MKYKIEGGQIRTEDGFPFAICGEGDNPFAAELVRRANAFDGLAVACRWRIRLEKWRAGSEFVHSTIAYDLARDVPDVLVLCGPLKYEDAIDRVTRQIEKLSALAEAEGGKQ